MIATPNNVVLGNKIVNRKSIALELHVCSVGLGGRTKDRIANAQRSPILCTLLLEHKLQNNC